MKKLTILICILSLLALAVPSLAEQNGGGRPPQMGQGQQPGGGPGGPGGPGGKNPPEKPDGDSSDKTPPEKPEGDSGDQGKQPGGAPQDDTLKQLVDAGTLSQTTYDAIREYMKNNGKDTQTPPEKPDGDSSDKTPPEKPDGSNPPAGQPGGLTQEMLQSMLDAGVITQDEYTTLLASVTSAASEETAEESSAETSEESSTESAD